MVCNLKTLHLLTKGLNWVSRCGRCQCWVRHYRQRRTLLNLIEVVILEDSLLREVHQTPEKVEVRTLNHRLEVILGALRHSLQVRSLGRSSCFCG